MAELHVIGQILSASNFPDQRLFCKWNLHLGGGWRLLQGLKSGQTQTDSPTVDNCAYFSHPIDLHVSTRTMQGWPKMLLEVYHQDQFGRQEIYGYGFVHIPSIPGEHEIECVIWRPCGTYREEVMQKFVGGGMQLKNIESFYSAIDKGRLKTISMGTVQLRIGVIMRNFDKFGVECC